MNNFLVNLAHRGAGLGPWAAVGPPASKPDFTAGAYLDNVAHRRLAVRSRNPERPPGDNPLPTPSRQPVNHAAEDNRQRRHGDETAETPSSMEIPANPVSPKTGKNAPSATADDGVPPGRRPVAVMPPRQPVDREDRRPGNKAVEITSETSDPLLQMKGPPDRNPIGSVRPQFGTTQSALDASKEMRGLPAKQHSFPEHPADGNPDAVPRTEDTIRPPAVQPAKRLSKRVDPLVSPSQASSVPISESRSSVPGDQKANLRAYPDTQSGAENPGPQIVVTPSDSHRQLMAAVKAASAVLPGAGTSPPEHPATEPPVQVRIGRVEVRAVQARQMAPSQPKPPARTGGFGAYHAVRNYEFSEH